MNHLPTLKNPFKQTLSLIVLCGIFACSETPRTNRDLSWKNPNRPSAQGHGKKFPPDRTPCPHRGIGPVSRLLQGTAHNELQSRSQQELVQFQGGKRRTSHQNPSLWKTYRSHHCLLWKLNERIHQGRKPQHRSEIRSMATKQRRYFGPIGRSKPDRERQWLDYHQNAWRDSTGNR